jgi:hypothetical protein
MRLDYSIDPATRDVLFHGRVSESELLSERIAEAIGKEIVRQVSEVIVLEKGAEIMAGIDVNAIANMVIAQAAADISHRIADKLKA